MTKQKPRAEPKEPKRINRSTNPKSTWKFPEVLPKTPNQKKAFAALEEGVVVLLDGMSGTGKSYIGLYKAAKALYKGEISRIILLRPYQPLASRSWGLLPGEISEKMQIYYAQMLEYLAEFLGKAQVEILLKNKTIELCALESIRGSNWCDAIVFVEEAQTLFIEEAQAVVTRISDNCQVIFAGDNSGFQSDIRERQNGFDYLLKLQEKYKIKSVSAARLTKDDIQRSSVVKDLVGIFEKEKESGVGNLYRKP